MIIPIYTGSENDSHIRNAGNFRFMALNNETPREVLAVMDQHVQYYNERNEGKVLALFSKTVWDSVPAGRRWLPAFPGYGTS